MSLNSVELFAGAGGLAMGVALAGFKSRAVVEWNAWACDTLRANQTRGYPLVSEWPLYEGDVRAWSRELDEKLLSDDLDLVAGGPPCQPFSLGGKHRAFLDDRDMFPATVDVIRRLRPRSFIIENVRGLTRATFSDYFEYVLLQLEFPEIARRAGDSWADHHGRLQVFKTSRRHGGVGLNYRLVVTLANAADYGVPQRRERVFIVGFRSDVDARWSFPAPTHSLDALLFEQWLEGSYWERHQVVLKQRPSLTGASLAMVERLRGLPLLPTHAPWRTVRDTFVGMPEPELGPESRASESALSEGSFINHRLQLGAKPYPGHTGSPLDLPAKTLKAGDHGVPGGENMLLRPDGSVRYFSVRESARLQAFPDGFEIRGGWSEAMRQLGNAVPVTLAQVVASSVAAHLLNARHREQLATHRSTANFR
jgi:DNA (cytosine-5)-methyltransferase 1